jgi:ribosome biogenesis protein SSF1/2
VGSGVQKGGKKKGQAPPPVEDNKKKVEQSFVMKRGKIGKTLQSLLEDTRRVMLPHTALHLRVPHTHTHTHHRTHYRTRLHDACAVVVVGFLQERKSNTLKDFIHVAGPLGVTHFIIFSATDFGSYMRIARVPHGPTLTFRISSYAPSSLPPLSSAVNTLLTTRRACAHVCVVCRVVRVSCVVLCVCAR